MQALPLVPEASNTSIETAPCNPEAHHGSLWSEVLTNVACGTFLSSHVMTALSLGPICAAGSTATHKLPESSDYEPRSRYLVDQRGMDRRKSLRTICVHPSYGPIRS